MKLREALQSLFDEAAAEVSAELSVLSLVGVVVLYNPFFSSVWI